jgi:hypothetical protein
LSGSTCLLDHKSAKAMGDEAKGAVSLLSCGARFEDLVQKLRCMVVERRCSPIPSYIRVISKEENPRIWEDFGKESFRPENPVLVGPSSICVIWGICEI